PTQRPPVPRAGEGRGEGAFGPTLVMVIRTVSHGVGPHPDPLPFAGEGMGYRRPTLWSPLPWGSNCVGCQGVGVACQGWWEEAMALSTSSSFRIAATRATFGRL